MHTNEEGLDPRVELLHHGARIKGPMRPVNSQATIVHRKKIKMETQPIGWETMSLISNTSVTNLKCTLRCAFGPERSLKTTLNNYTKYIWKLEFLNDKLSLVEADIHSMQLIAY